MDQASKVLQGPHGIVGNQAPAPMGMIPAIVINDDGLGVGKELMWAYGSDAGGAAAGDVSGFFHDADGNIESYSTRVTMQAGGALNTMVTASVSTSGMLDLTLAGGSSAADATPTVPTHTDTNTTSYGNSLVEVMAIDAEDLWTSQMVYVRRIGHQYTGSLTQWPPIIGKADWWRRTPSAPLASGQLWKSRLTRRLSMTMMPSWSTRT